MICSRLNTLTLLLAFAALGTATLAQASGDAKAGAGKAGLCAACHGANGISSNSLWPNLAGQQQPYLAKQIKAFRDGERTEPTMAPFVSNLSDQDADDLAAHFASLKGCP